MPESKSEKPKKVRDIRTHDERFTALSIAFAQCKAAAYASGKVNDCSASKILEKSGVQRSYLYGDRIADKTVQEAYHQVATEIQDFRDEFQENKGFSGPRITVKMNIESGEALKVYMKADS